MAIAGIARAHTSRLPGVGISFGSNHHGRALIAWFVYIIEADDGTLYTGVTTDVTRRFAEHQSGPRGARFFNGRSPVRVAWSEAVADRIAACKREAAIKKLPRSEKLALADGCHSTSKSAR